MGELEASSLLTSLLSSGRRYVVSWGEISAVVFLSFGACVLHSLLGKRCSLAQSWHGRYGNNQLIPGWF